MTPRTFLATASLGNLAANLLFPVLALRALGLGAAADALFLVFILPGVALVLLGNSVLNWSTPRLVRRPGDASRRALCWSLLWVLLAGAAAAGLLLWALGAWLRPSLAAGSGYALAVEVLPLALLAVLATVVTALAQSLYTAERAVAAAEGRTLLANVAALACWLAADPLSLAGCAWLFVLRAVLIAGCLLPRLGRPRRPDAADPDLRAVLRESRVLLLAAGYYKSEPFVDRLLLAAVPGGAAGAFHLAQQVAGMVSLLMNRTVTAPLVAPLAASVHAQDAPAARRLLRRALQRMLLAGALAWLLFVVAGEPLLALAFAGTALDAAALASAAQLLALTGGYLLGVLCGQVLAQAYYCTGSTRQVVWLGVAGYTLGLVLKVLALWQLGAPGLVAAASLSWLINALLYRLWLPRPLFRR